MSDSVEKVRKIKSRIEELIALQKRLVDENRELQQRFLTEQQKNEAQNIIIEELLEKNRVLKISKSINNGAVNSELKVKIDEMVRELDKCIGLLNK